MYKHQKHTSIVELLYLPYYLLDFNFLTQNTFTSIFEKDMCWNEFSEMIYVHSYV